MVSHRFFPLLSRLRRKSAASSLLIAPPAAVWTLAVVTKEPLVLPLEITPPLDVDASKPKVQIVLKLTGLPLPASEQLCAKGCAALSIALVTASNRGTSFVPSCLRSSMKVARLQVFAPTTRYTRSWSFHARAAVEAGSGRP